jgi:hypothetical protein
MHKSGQIKKVKKVFKSKKFFFDQRVTLGKLAEAGGRRNDNSW